MSFPPEQSVIVWLDPAKKKVNTLNLGLLMPKETALKWAVSKVQQTFCAGPSQMICHLLGFCFCTKYLMENMLHPLRMLPRIR